MSHLKPVPQFDTQTDKRHQAPIFTATAEDDRDENRRFNYEPHKPLHWWYRTQSSGWHPIPDRALLQIDKFGRMVRVNTDELDHRGAQFALGHAGGQPQQPGSGGARGNGGGRSLSVAEYWIAVTEDDRESPSDDHAVSFKSFIRPPEVPIPLEGEGTANGQPSSSVEVSLSRARQPNTADEILWVVIRNSANELAFNPYQDFMDALFSNPRIERAANLEKKSVSDALDLHCKTFAFSSIDAYRVLKIATELFVTTRCGVLRPPALRPDPQEEEARFGHRLGAVFETLWEDYLEPLGNFDGRTARILPYLDLIRRKLGDIGAVRSSTASLVDQQAELIQDKLVHPILLELIWSYWMEEGMLVQSFNSITRRFQNLRTNGERDPLGQMEIDPLRPVNNLLWGYVQDEMGQLSVLRRAHEYDHHYGFTLHGKALAELRTVERRSKFLEAFHNLLHRCMQFYSRDDDTTVIADAFPVLNALKETHYLLAQGAHNQFGNLPSQARQEMLMQQWILSRPEVREFLGTRVMVPYPEPWMDRVDAVKTLKGWTDTSVLHFRDLATFGEQILLSVRYGAWSTVDQMANAANWARYWRPEIQGYIHAYRIATSVDLTADVTDQKSADTRFMPPSVHLRNRLLAQAAPR